MGVEPSVTFRCDNCGRTQESMPASFAGHGTWTDVHGKRIVCCRGCARQVQIALEVGRSS